MNIERIMYVANRAKTIGKGKDYKLANAIFSILLMQYFNRYDEPLDGEYRVEMGEMSLKVCVETEDTLGLSKRQVNYDLLTIVVTDKDGQGVNSLCIPIPLLSSCTVISAMKTAEIVERGEHLRKYEGGDEKEMDLMWEEILEVIPHSQLYDAVRYALGDSEESQTELIVEHFASANYVI